MAVTENLQRKDVTPIEEANAYQRLIESGRHKGIQSRERQRVLQTANGQCKDNQKPDIRTVLHFHPALAPVKIGVLPLSKKLNEGAEKVYTQLCKKYNCEFDDRGNIGKRYRRLDEIGTPFCVTYDFESETDGCVTVRDRDTMEQVRVPIAELKNYFEDKFRF